MWGLRWATGWLSDCGELYAARGCADALSRIALAGHPDAQAALASALAETAFADGHADVAAEQFALAVEIHRGLDIPFERAEILLRSSRALDAIGDRAAAIANLVEAYRIAQRLNAAPVAAAATDQVARLGESIEQHLGRRAAADHETAGLSRREVEVVRLVAEGLTNREIAGRLVLSTRTVDMHVRNILGKLGARTRTEAVTHAAGRGLLAPVEDAGHSDR